MSPKYAHAAEYQYRKMELPLASMSDCEVWSVIRFLCACGETTAEIHCQISAVYNEECMSKSMVSHEHFADKRFNTTEEIKAAVVKYFQNLDAEYCHTGLQKLHKRYMKCLYLQGIMWKNREFCGESA